MVHIEHGDCLELMKNIPDESIDLILCDLPYGTTVCKWDKPLNFERMWEQYKRIIKPLHAIVLFGGEPFSSQLRLSNPAWYKYDWCWVKNNAAGFVNAKLKPMNKHETISVFSEGKTANCNPRNMVYHPQGLIPLNKKVGGDHRPPKENTYWRPSMSNENRVQEFTNYPTTILNFARPHKNVHPTQKPVDLLEYLIRTYTNEGETVLDNCMGSGSTGVAAVNTGRNFIGYELEEKYFDIASERIYGAMAQHWMKESEEESQDVSTPQ